MKLKNAFSNKRYIKIKYHTIENSILEAVITRGDLATAQLIRTAWQLGAKYDAWNECFNFNIWQQAIGELGLDIEQLVGNRAVSDPLPWSFINTGVTSEFFKAEWEKAQAETTTVDCRQECSLCGVCNQDIHTVDAVPAELVVALDSFSGKPALQNVAEYRYRVYYQKTGLLRFISHLDWMRMLFRLISILKLDVVYTQGFNPHPKVSLSPPLPLGVIGTCEYFDVSFTTKWELNEISKELNGFKIQDFQIVEVLSIKAQDSKIQPVSEAIGIRSFELYREQILSGIAKFQSADEVLYEKKREKGNKTYSLKQIIESFEIGPDEILITKKLNSPALFELLANIFGVPKNDLYGLEVKRLKFIY